MKVREMIAELLKLDPDLDVVVMVHRYGDLDEVPATVGAVRKSDYGSEPVIPIEEHVREQCTQCGAEVLGHHACQGVPGWEEGTDEDR